MRYFDKSILATLLSAVLLLTSCIYEEGDGAENDTDQTFVVLTLSMAGEQRGTRAGAWGDNDYRQETATKWENTIQQGQLMVLVYDLNNKFIGKVDYLTYSVDKDVDNNKVYKVRGTLKKSDGTSFDDGQLSCKLVVIANYDDAITLTDNSVLSDIANMSYDYDVTGIAEQSTYIPMWGVSSYGANGKAALTLEVGKETDAGTIDMLRTMAKIRVHLSTTAYKNSNKSAAEQYDIESATFSSYNTKGHIFPAGYANVYETKELLYAGNSYNVLNSEVNTELSFADEYGFTKAVNQIDTDNSTINYDIQNKGQSFILYVPEYATTADNNTNATTPSIQVTLKAKDNAEAESTYSINLRKYTADGESGDALNLIRNTVYDYEITMVSETLTLQYQAMDWISKTPTTIIFE